MWFQNATVHAVDASAFRNLDGDGWGDLAGTRERLDYELSETCSPIPDIPSWTIRCDTFGRTATDIAGFGPRLRLPAVPD